MGSYSEEISALLDSLAPNERNAFRARKSKYIKKGFSSESALQKALVKVLNIVDSKDIRSKPNRQRMNHAPIDAHRSKTASTTINSLKSSGIVPKRGSTRSVKLAKFKTITTDRIVDFCQNISGPFQSLPSFRKEQDPTYEQIQAEVRKLKAQGIFTETNLSFYAQNVIPFPIKTPDPEVKLTWATPEQIILTKLISPELAPVIDQTPPQAADPKEENQAFLALQIVASLAVIAMASGLLMYSSAEAFGDGWVSYLKAALLEVAIVSLSIWKTKNVWSLIVARFFALAAIMLSLLVLHAGVQKSEDLNLSMLSATSEDIGMLKRQFASAIGAHDQLDPSWVSKRQAAMEKAEEIRIKIKEAESNIQQGGAATTVQKLHLAESGLRVVLLVLNILFSHHLMSLAQRKNGS